jgi:5-methyltetrahydrofolate--homocysteine methyltransferase
LGLKKAITEGNASKAVEVTVAAIQQGIAAEDVLQKALVPGIREIGDLFGKGECFLPELVVSGRAMEAAVKELEPYFCQGKSIHTGKYLIGTVKGDIHNIGKNIVIMMLRGNGWAVTDLGVDIAPEEFCAAIKEGDYDIVGLSALLTTTIPHAFSTVKAFQDAGLRSKVKVMIGGAPVTQHLADRMGADAYGKDAWDAVVKAEGLLG